MQRYFFNLANETYPLDLQGVELPCMASIEMEVTRFAGEVCQDRLELAPLDGDFQVEVSDAMGNLLFTFIAATTTATAIRSHLC